MGAFFSTGEAAARISYQAVALPGTEGEKGMQECDVHSGSLAALTRALRGKALWEMVYFISQTVCGKDFACHSRKTQGTS